MIYRWYDLRSTKTLGSIAGEENLHVASEAAEKAKKVRLFRKLCALSVHRFTRQIMQVKTPQQIEDALCGREREARSKAPTVVGSPGLLAGAIWFG